MNRMVLEESASRFYEYNQKLMAEFNASMKKGNAWRRHSRTDGKGTSREDAGGFAE
jgi:hypothetical protein